MFVYDYCYNRLIVLISVFQNIVEVNDFRENEITPVFNSDVSTINSMWGGPFSDAEIVVGDKCFNVHRTILASKSPYFLTMFTSSFIEGASSRPRVVLNEVDAGAVEIVLRVIYQDFDLGKLTVGQAFSVVQAASLFQVQL